MATSPLWHRLSNLHISRRALITELTIAAVTPFLAFAIVNLLAPKSKPAVLQSPRNKTPTANEEDIPYPDDALLGARDVNTPYGSIRIYEWGPSTGRKVLFVHGISTPCIAFASMAKLLVEQHGCRVMLFDLFGRGYSDAPDPAVYRQDIGLWTSQVLLCLSSSELSWTGSERFTLIGYSLGGGIAAAFTSYFPGMVESLVLIAPGGLIRRHRISSSSKLLYGNLLPPFLVRYFVGRRLRGSPLPPGYQQHKPSPAKKDENEDTTPADAVASEVPEPDHDHPAHAADSPAPILPSNPHLSIADAVGWQVDAHPGFVPSFVSSIQHSPITDSHWMWQKIGRNCAARKASPKGLLRDDSRPAGLDENAVLIIFGAQDAVVLADEVGEDATKALGEANVRIVRLEGGHDVPVVNARGCVDEIVQFWAGADGRLV